MTTTLTHPNNARLKAAEKLARAIDIEDPNLATLAEEIAHDNGLTPEDIAAKAKELDLRGTADRPHRLTGKNLYPEAIITLLAEQLPHPAEGL